MTISGFMELKTHRRIPHYRNFESNSSNGWDPTFQVPSNGLSKSVTK